MKTPDNQLLFRARMARGAAAWLAGLFCGSVIAATTDIANAPLFTSSHTAVKPNIMFILDDSGSMERDYMPDEAVNFGHIEYGRRAAQCNGLAYDPLVTYDLPVNADGTDKAAASITTEMGVSNQLDTVKSAANITSMPTVGSRVTVTVTSGSRQSNWYVAGNDTSGIVTVFASNTKFFTGKVYSWSSSSGELKIDVLSTVGTGGLSSPQVGRGLANTYYTYTGSQPKLGYVFLSNGDVDTGTTFYKECNSDILSTPGSGVFTAHSMATDNAKAQNYANWKKYYSTRMDMMKTAVSLAFKGVDNRYRVGFSTISSRNASEGDSFLNIREFSSGTGSQKEQFYSKLFAATPGITTPLRGALAKAGQYYANKAPSQSVDPIQYSCQRNFTILSTDGYWNTGYETSTYGPYDLNGVRVGQRDGGATLRPMFDGGSVTTTTTETWTATRTIISQTVTPKVTTSSVVRSTTTQAPVNANSGRRRTAYELVPAFSLTGASFTRSGNVVTVTVPSGHDLVVGDRIDVSTTSSNNFNESFEANDTNVTWVSGNQFRYNDNGSNGTAGGSASFTVRPGGVSCPSGQAVQRAVTQTWDRVTKTTVHVTESTTTHFTETYTTTRVETTPYRRVTRVVNGVQVSDTTTALTMTPTSSNSPTTTTWGTPTLSILPGVPANIVETTDSAVTTVPGGNVEYSCRSSAQGPGGTTTGLPSSTGTVTTTNTATSTNTPAAVATTTVISNTVTESPHTSSSSSTTNGGSSNTLADVAMYYYETDLRDTGLNNCVGALGTNVCANNVPGATADAAHSYGDTATHQHMTTFTLGLGASGFLKYDPNYLTQLSGDFFDITNASKDWSIPTETSNGGGPENIDDLWHAAVNGRGQYFAASDPQSLTDGLNATLDKIKAVTGSASAASTSSLQPVQGDNDIFLAQFTTQLWVGDVLKFTIDPLTGNVSNTPTWSAKAKLDGQSAASRRILYAKPDGSETLRDFNATNLATDGYGAHFTNFCSKAGAGGGTSPSQCGDLDGTELAAANSANNLVNFLRGDRTATYYRARENLLGDIINASPLYVGKPGFQYNENGYQSFKAAKSTRAAVVLAAANDGMLHAIDRVTGEEKWAFIPSFVMPNLYKLADKGYADNHHYFVDGSPQVGDIYVNGAWKTIVVGGLNAGGRGYYALDVTDTLNPKLLWEFKHDDLGLTYGNPIITKQADGTWVVVFASGYNNVGPGDGNGHLFVLDAGSGDLIKKISTFTGGTTAAGTTATPNGLAKINVWVDSELANDAKRFYGGDLLGNLWRFDIDGLVAPNNAALRLAQLTSTDGQPQPITSKPTLAEVNYNGSKFPVVYVATGKYLGTTDLSDSRVQSVYAIKDPLTNSPYGVVRSDGNFVAQTITASGTNRTTTDNAVNWMVNAGWRADLPAGERVSVNPVVALQTLFVGSNLPSNDSCTVGGQSFLYRFNIASGKATSTYVGNVMIQGVTVVQLVEGAAAGTVVSIISKSDGTLDDIPDGSGGGTPTLRRTSWRELVD